MANLPNNTIAEITRQVAAMFTAVAASDTERGEAQEILSGAREKATTTRTDALVKIAALAHEHQWDGQHIEQGVDAAKAQRNNQKDTSIATFAAEIKRSCHPSVRKHVKDLFALADTAWTEEKDQDDKPLRRAFVRKYHMVVGPMFDAAIAGKPPLGASDLAAMASERLTERKQDFRKVKARLDKIKAELASFHETFPVDGIGDCLDFLGSVTEAELKACVTPKAAPAPTTNSAPEQEPVTGAVELEDVLGDMTGGTTELKAA